MCVCERLGLMLKTLIKPFVLRESAQTLSLCYSPPRSAAVTVMCDQRSGGQE